MLKVILLSIKKIYKKNNKLPQQQWITNIFYLDSQYDKITLQAARLLSVQWEGVEDEVLNVPLYLEKNYK